MNTPVREGETIEGSRTTRNRPYPVLKCSSTDTKVFDRPAHHSSPSLQQEEGTDLLLCA